MKINDYRKKRQLLKSGDYELINMGGNYNKKKSTIKILDVTKVNIKGLYSTYKTTINTGLEKNTIAYIKLCDSLDYAVGLGNQYKSFNEITMNQTGLKAPALIGYIESPPCLVIANIKGKTIDDIIKDSDKNEIGMIGDRVALFLSLYHEKHELPIENKRLCKETINFASLNNLRLDKVTNILRQVNVQATIVHQDPKLANFIWNYDTSTLGVLDPTHKPYIRYPTYDLAVVLYFPLFVKSALLAKKLRVYRHHIITSYCSYRKIEWNWADAALSAINLLQLYDTYEKTCMFFGFAKGLLYRQIISMRRYYIVRKFNLK
ncbi:hypothetical protein N9C84_02825 [Desulfobacterales bacterium]|nr:hypothetical protein [Desulfobacterales bacterium]